ncbi:MAG: hypothetical protein V4864_12585 [Pseudomonadota bacterium]
MNHRGRPFLTFLALAVGVFMVANVGAEVLARVWVSGHPPGKAARETLHYLAAQPLGALMLVAPFLLLAWMAASLAKARTFESGLILFGIAALALTALYVLGHVAAEQAVNSRQWTAAALSVGLLPFQSIPVLVLALLARLLLGRKRA